jgi:hypothetical protein
MEPIDRDELCRWGDGEEWPPVPTLGALTEAEAALAGIRQGSLSPAERLRNAAHLVAFDALDTACMLVASDRLTRLPGYGKTVLVGGGLPLKVFLRTRMREGEPSGGVDEEVRARLSGQRHMWDTASDLDVFITNDQTIGAPVPVVRRLHITFVLVRRFNAFAGHGSRKPYRLLCSAYQPLAAYYMH